MRRPSANPRLETVALAAVLASPLPMLALAPEGGVTLLYLLAASIPVALGWGIYRLALRGRPRPLPRPALVPPPLGPLPPQIHGLPFHVGRGRALIVQGTFEDVLAAARAGRLAARLSLVAVELSALDVLLFAAGLVPLPILRRDWRRIAAGRAQGLVPEPPPRRTLGSTALDAAMAGPTPATRRVLLVVVAVSVLAMLLPPEALLDRLAKD